MLHKGLNAPITIGGITITQELIQALDELTDFGPQSLHSFAEQSMIISSLNTEEIGLDRNFFCIMLAMYKVLKALHAGKEEQPQ